MYGAERHLVKKITIRESEAPDAKVICVRETREKETELILGEFTAWSPEHPHLYGISIEAGENRVESYFGMRKFTLEQDEKGVSRLFLNGKPYFQNGILDQGYWPESLDPTRQIDHASGWYDQGAGDIKSLHNYFRPLKVKPERRAFTFSEYGGYTYPVPGHLYSDKSFGYRSYQNQAQYQAAMDALAEKIRRLEKERLAAAVYTQLSDVEEETNGILTYDRRECKWKR